MSSNTAKVTLPVLPVGVSAQQAFDIMKQSGRSAAVYKEGHKHYLIEAGAAFVAVRTSVWAPRSVGILLDDAHSSAGEHFGLVAPPPAADHSRMKL
jgi:hypothetical protein